MNVEFIDLERLRVAAQITVPASVRRATIETLEEPVFDTLVYRLSSYVLAHRLAEFDAYHEQPASWFQHLKATLGLKHRTVRRPMHIVRYRTYPDWDIFLPEDRFGGSVLREVVS